MTGYFGPGGPSSITIHNQLNALTSDDHPQYLSAKFQRVYGYSAGGEIDAIGNTTAKNEKYDDVANSWSAKTSLGASNYEMAGFSLNGYGYSIGNGSVSGRVEKYDDIANTWTAKTSLTTSRCLLSGFVINGFGFGAGGDTSGGGANTASVEKYDDVANTWAAMTGLTTARYELTGFSINNFGYTAGGSGVTAAVEKYDNVANTWATKASITTARHSLSGFSLNAFGYCSGGVTAVNYTIIADRYDDVLNAWAVKGSLNAAKFATCGFSLNNYGYSVGGVDTQPTAAVEKYDDVANSWTAKTGLPTARGYLAGFSQGQITEQKVMDPIINNTLMLNSRRSIICGSFNTSSSTSGICACAHGLATAPVVAWAMPIETIATKGQRQIALQGIGGTNVSFVIASCPLITAASTTSSISVNFIWAALP